MLYGLHVPKFGLEIVTESMFLDRADAITLVTRSVL